MKYPKILECTLRDGSYEIDFQFSKNDTVSICSALDYCGFELIEVGHGVGLGASERGIGVALETDEVYMKAASESVKKGNWGMFAIPGIANLEHLTLAEYHGMDFVRLGSTIFDFKKCEKFISSAKNKSMLTYVNFMKSYTVSPSKLAKAAKAAFEIGADAVYVVDSAGGMLPQEVTEYVQAILAECPSLTVGFHGHNNLGLGVGNALAAINAGAEIIDSSLQGFGRSAGNTSTEQIIGCLARMGLEGKIDPIQVMDLGEELIKPLINKNGLSSIDTISGMSLFHSSYMPIIFEMSQKYKVDPRHLIISVCKEDTCNAPEEMVERHAIELLKIQKAKGHWKPSYKNYHVNEQVIL